MSELSVGLGIPPRPPIRLIDSVVDNARAAGASTLWMIDHFTSFVPQSIWGPGFSASARHSPSPDRIFEAFTTMGYVAAKAPELRLAVGVTEAIRRHPLMLAQAFLTLTHMSSGGAILGMGSGEAENLIPIGLPFERPVSRLEEALEVVRLAMTSAGPFDFEGDYFHLDRAILDLEAGPGGAPEVWVAAHGPRMLRITGERADGWYPTVPMDASDYGGRLDVIQAAAAASNRSMEAFTPGAQMFVVVGESDEHARRLLDAGPVRLMGLLLPAHAWEEAGHAHPLESASGGMIDFIPQHFDRASIERALESVPDEILERCVTWGSASTVIDRVRELEEAGLRHAVLIPVPGTEIVPPGDDRSVFSLCSQLVGRDAA